VISTERFLTAGISPQFTEQEGVTLNSSKTQALIPEIAVGETFTLHATVTLPSDIVSQELINQVTVVAKETGSKSVQSQAGVDIRASYITDTPTPVPTALSYYQSDNQSKSGTQSYGTSSKPQTSDPSQPGLFLGLLVASLTSLGMIFWRRKAKSRD
jgi:hypothetical protein